MISNEFFLVFKLKPCTVCMIKREREREIHYILPVYEKRIQFKNKHTSTNQIELLKYWSKLRLQLVLEKKNKLCTIHYIFTKLTKYVFDGNYRNFNYRTRSFSLSHSKHSTTQYNVDKLNVFLSLLAFFLLGFSSSFTAIVLFGLV